MQNEYRVQIANILAQIAMVSTRIISLEARLNALTVPKVQDQIEKSKQLGGE